MVMSLFMQNSCNKNKYKINIAYLGKQLLFLSRYSIYVTVKNLKYIYIYIY